YTNISNDSAFGATATGWYFLHLVQKDNCRDYLDSIYVVVRPGVTPQIISSGGLMEDAIPVGNCLHKLTIVSPDTVTLSVQNVAPGSSYLWSTPAGTSANPTVAAYLPGSYGVSVTSPDGLCTASACLDVLVFTQLNGPGHCGLPTQLQIHLNDPVFD